MTIKLNGQVQQISAGTTVAAIIVQHQLTADKVAVELNKRLLRSANYGTVLNEGDEVEIVTFVGGG